MNERTSGKECFKKLTHKNVSPEMAQTRKEKDRESERVRRRELMRKRDDKRMPSQNDSIFLLFAIYFYIHPKPIHMNVRIFLE